MDGEKRELKGENEIGKESSIEKIEERERELVKDRSGQTNVGEEVIQIRKDRIVKFFKKDIFISIFLIIAVVSLFLAIKDLGFTGFLSNLFSLKFIKELRLATLLFILSTLSLIACYKNRRNLSYYPILVWVVLLSYKIRTRNLDKLKDVTTGTWTLGPDLDPFLFLRWAEYIVENGKLYAIDMMRYVPLGHDTTKELLFHPYLMAWFHKFFTFFGSESVTYSAVIYPAFMFALTVIVFFLLTRTIFIDRIGKDKANIVAIISSIFLSIIPALLPRTIAGIPEKESVAFLFIFLGLYFFILAWKAKKIRSGILFGLLAGMSSAGMALIWGGYGILFLTIIPSVFIVFLTGDANKNKIYSFASWILFTFIFMNLFSMRYTIKNLLTSLYSGTALIVLAIMLLHVFAYNKYISKYFKSDKLNKIPPKIISTLIVVTLAIIISTAVLGPSFITSQIVSIEETLINPNTARLIQTVAENKQPFLVDWWESFGPSIRGTPLFFWLFFIGSAYLFYKAVYTLKNKERIILTTAYFFFLLAITFSRYSGSSSFNGSSTISLLFYSLGYIVFAASIGYYYYKYHKDKEESQLKEIEFGFVILVIFFILSILAARNAIRLTMVLVPSVSIIVSYFLVSSFYDARRIKGDVLKIIAWTLFALVFVSTIFSGYQFYKSIDGQASGYAPSAYTQQWQKAMAWVRENTPKSAVFGHWWDYGYWLQSIGERATVLDGGNAQSYWNYLMGRYPLTGSDNRKALDFLYAHNTTHFLIDSTDIGKYTAFSSIGSDSSYDRRSWLSVFERNNDQTKETKNGTLFIYTGGTSLDGDITYEENGEKVYLPGGKAALGAVLVERDSSGELTGQPHGIYVYQNNQYTLPLRYAYDKGMFLDFGSGIEAGVFIFSRVVQNNEQFNMESDGALIYLSDRTVKSQLARLYLYKENNPNFKLVHSEDDFLVAYLKSQNLQVGDIVLFDGLRGPIRIWEINYPKDIELKEEYLSTYYPEEIQYA